MGYLLAQQTDSALGGITAVIQSVFGGDMAAPPYTILQIAARAALIYVVGLVIIRIGKSRLLGRNTALDVILGFILGSLLSRGITGHASMSGTAAGCAALVAIHWVFTALAFRWHRFGSLIKGNMRALVENGQLIRPNMQRSHVSERDLMEELRLQGLDDLRQVRSAYKERNGQVSVIKSAQQPRVVEIAVRDGVQTVRIEFAGAE